MFLCSISYLIFLNFLCVKILFSNIPLPNQACLFFLRNFQILIDPLFYLLWGQTKTYLKLVYQFWSHPSSPHKISLSRSIASFVYHPSRRLLSKRQTTQVLASKACWSGHKIKPSSRCARTSLRHCQRLILSTTFFKKEGRERRAKLFRQRGRLSCRNWHLKRLSEIESWGTLNHGGTNCVIYFLPALLIIGFWPNVKEENRLERMNWGDSHSLFWALC